MTKTVSIALKYIINNETLNKLDGSIDHRNTLFLFKISVAAIALHWRNDT